MNTTCNVKTFVVDGVSYTLTEMLTANADDRGMCEWLVTAEIGERFSTLADCWRST